MLSTIRIESLFNVYSYTLELKPEERPFCFITGPNGYGKTTILNLLNALYTGDMKMLSVIPYRNLRLMFDDNREVVVSQEREYVEEEESDEPASCQVSLLIEFKTTNPEKLITSMKWYEEDEQPDEEDMGAKVLSLYFQSHPVYYIRDGRIRTPEGMPAVKEYAELLKRMLNEDPWTTDGRFKQRLETFRDIIVSSEFAHKRMEIDKRYGFRFVADNEERTILSVEKLSSGEQHILIMSFELLFLAPDDSLVLIDEPEMSFHMSWLVDYLKNLRSMTDLRKSQCIICTHAPQIFNFDYDGLSIDLFTQSNSKSEVTCQVR